MGTRPLIVTVRDRQTGVCYSAAFDDSPVLLGRGDDVTLQVDRPHVSVHHATIVFTDDGITFTDLDSRNGTMVDGVVHGGGTDVDVTESSVLHIGACELTFSRNPSRRPAPNAENPFASKSAGPKPATGVLAKDAIDRIRRELQAAKAPVAPAPQPILEPELQALAAAFERQSLTAAGSGAPPQGAGSSHGSWSGPVPELRPDDHTEMAPPPVMEVEPPVAPAAWNLSAFGAVPLPRTLVLPRPPPPAAAPIVGGNELAQPGSAVPAAAMPVAAHVAGTLPTGTLLGGRFRLQGLLGRGGMGVVYRAHDENLNVDVAIKTLAHARDMTPALLERFFREAKVIRAVSHPNIVVVHDVGMDGDLPYIAMELLKGEDLATAIERAPLEVSAAVDIMLGVCAGLHAAHERGLVHRDLKPQNIFLSQAWRVQDVPKILDFGISKTSDSKLTQAGDIMGTEHYLSPEQAQDSNAVDARSDIYALGVILYQCVAQRPPHDGANIYLVIKNIVEGNVRPLREVRPDVSERFAAVVHRAMAIDPAERHPSAHELARALLPFASSRGQRLWSDHFSALPPMDPMLSTPHRVAGEVLKGPSSGNEPRPPYMAGGTRVLPSADPSGSGGPKSTPPRESECARRSEPAVVQPAQKRVRRSTVPIWAWGAGVVVLGAVAAVAVLVTSSRDRHNSVTPSPVVAPVAPSLPRQPEAPAAAAPEPAPPIPPVPTMAPASTEKPKPKRKRKRVRYNADGIPLVE
jgi:serine/threonine-protein kinase